MNKRNALKSLALTLGALLTICFTQALILPEGVPIQAAIDLAKKLKASRSIASRYTGTGDFVAPYHPTYFITNKHVITLVKEHENIQQIAYQTEDAPILRTVKPISNIQKVGDYNLFLYELNEPIEDVVPLKLLSNYDELPNLVKETVYVLTYGVNPEEMSDSVHQLKAAFTTGVQLEQETISVPFENAGPDKTEVLEPNSFLLTNTDFGCALVSLQEEGPVLLGLGYGSDAMDRSVPFLCSPHSYFTTPPMQVIEKLKHLLPELTTPSELKLNLFDHLVHWCVGDKITISSDHIWTIKHPDGREEKRLGLVHPNMKLNESVSFEVKQIERTPTGYVKLSNKNITYEIWPNGTVSIDHHPKNKVTIYTNGWIKNCRIGDEPMLYKAPQHPSLLKKRSYRTSRGNIIVVHPHGEIEQRQGDFSHSQHQDHIITRYQSGVTETKFNSGLLKMEFPNGMIFQKDKKSPWKLQETFEPKKLTNDTCHYLRDGTKIIVYVENGKIEWIEPNGSRKVYFLDGSLVERYENGIIKTRYANGIQEMLFPNGMTFERLTSTAPWNPREIVNPKKPEQDIYHAPFITIYAADGRLEWMHDNGHKKIYYLNEALEEYYQDGLVKTQYKNERQEILFPNGMIFKSTDHSNWRFSSVRKPRKPLQDTCYQLPNGTQITVYANDGRLEWTDEKSSKKIYYLSKTVYTQYKQGHHKVIFPNGMTAQKIKNLSWEMTSIVEAQCPRQNIQQVLPDKSNITIYAEDGRLEWLLENGCKKIYYRDSIVLTQYKEGLQEVELPNGMVFTNTNGSAWDLKTIKKPKKCTEDIIHLFSVAILSINTEGTAVWVYDSGKTLKIYYLSGMVDTRDEKGSWARVLSNGATFASRDGIGWIHITSDKDRQYVFPNDTLVMIDTNEIVRWIYNGGKDQRTSYPSGVTDATDSSGQVTRVFPNGMVFTSHDDFNWEPKNLVESKRPSKDVEGTFPRGDKIVIRTDTGNLEWTDTYGKTTAYRFQDFGRPPSDNKPTTTDNDETRVQGGSPLLPNPVKTSQGSPPRANKTVNITTNNNAGTKRKREPSLQKTQASQDTSQKKQKTDDSSSPDKKSSNDKETTVKEEKPKEN